MVDNIGKLIAISSNSLLPTSISADGPTRELLEIKNGFYAFESALHVFPTGISADIITLETWNQHNCWKSNYSIGVDDLLCFAEDVFGCQYAMRGNEIAKFDPETGYCNHHSKTLQEWAGMILDDYEYETGYPLIHEWQISHGPIAVGHRLVPKVPFVLQGEFNVANLRPMVARDSMIYRSKLAEKLRNLPDGARIEYDIID